MAASPRSHPSADWLRQASNECRASDNFELSLRPGSNTGHRGERARASDRGRPRGHAQTEHRSRLCRFRHLAQPSEHALVGLRAALRQRIQPMPLLGGETSVRRRWTSPHPIARRSQFMWKYNFYLV
jgi:hypothetical protein